LARTVLKYEAARSNVAIIAALQPTDESPDGLVAESRYSVIAAGELQASRDRTRRGKQRHVDEGKPANTSRAPYGYAWGDLAKTFLVEDHSTAPTVRRIFSELADGVSLGQLAASLTSEGTPSPSGKIRWSLSSLQTILQRSEYWGEGVSFRHTVRRERRFRVDGEPYTVCVKHRTPERYVPMVQAAVPALVSQDVALRAIASVRARINRGERQDRSPNDYLLRGGFIRCGHCGATLVGYRETGLNDLPRYRCVRYRDGTCCRPGIVAHRVDLLVWSHVLAVLRRSQGWDRLHHRLKDRYGSMIEDTAAAYDAGIARIRHQQADLTQAIATVADTACVELLLPHHAELGMRLQALEEARERACDEQMQWRIVQQRLQQIRACARGIADDASLSHDDKRLALSLLHVQVTLWRKTHTPRVRIELALMDRGGYVVHEFQEPALTPLETA
jgi:site-specific DNA recombinase